MDIHDWVYPNHTLTTRGLEQHQAWLDLNDLCLEPTVHRLGCTGCRKARRHPLTGAYADCLDNCHFDLGRFNIVHKSRPELTLL